MTIDTPPHWPRVFAVGVFFDVAVAAQRVEHRFDLQANIRIGSVAVDAETLAGVVGEVVVAGDAVDCRWSRCANVSGSSGRVSTIV